MGKDRPKLKECHENEKTPNANQGLFRELEFLIVFWTELDSSWFF
jgi:hypothetical protein